MIKLDTPPQ